jgi:hypothetical protein
MKKSLAVFTGAVILLVTNYALASNFYVDGSLPVGGTHNGTSWATAWTKITGVTGVQPGDTVFISGGPSGSSQTYTNVVTPGLSHWQPTSGTPGHPITYIIGQDPLHNGTVVFDGSVENPIDWLAYPDYDNSTNVSNMIISGDAGDGKRHFMVTNYINASHGLACIEMSQNLRISYIDFGQSPGGMDGGSMNGFEFDHNYVYVADPNADHFACLNVTGTTWDQNKIHDNTIYVPHVAADPGIGADCFQICCQGCSIYNNMVIGYATNYTGGQHQDGWQAGGGNYIKIYGNLFVDMGNYAIFPEPAVAGYTHMRIYNNTVVMTLANQTQAIAVSGNSSKQCVDVIVANNLADGFGFPFTFRNALMSSDPDAFVECYFYNNVDVNTSFSNIIDPHVNSADNISLTSAAGAANFVSYIVGSAANDYHLKSGATSLIDQGTSVSSYFTTDKDGILRPQGADWDIGPYEYVSGSHQPPTCSITSPTNGANFTPGSDITITATASDSGGTVTKVDFYEGSNLIGTDNSAPYSMVWTSVPVGSYTLTARATDNSNAVGVSASVNITVNVPGNQAPACSITSPANAADFAAPANITISATASDSDGTVTNVEFYQGAVKLGSDAAAPYTYTWTNVPAGSYSLTVKAYDNAGASTVSASVGITVTTPSASWENHAFTSQNGSFTVELDATPNQAGLDTAIGLSSGAAGAYTDLACIFRFTDTNTIDARNGANYEALSTVPYTPGTSYHVKLVVSVPQHTYDIYVTPQGGSQVLLGQNYAFRTEQNGVASLANWVKYDALGVGGSTVTNFTIGTTNVSGPSGLVGWWKLDESAGTTAADSSGNGNNGTLSGGAWQASGGQLAGALNFNSGDYVDCGSGASLSTPSVTVAFWMKPSQMAVMGPVDKLPMTTGIGYALRLRDTGDIWFRLGSEPGTQYDVYGDRRYTNGVWTHVAATFDSASGAARLYINGVVAAHQPTCAITLNAASTHLLFAKENKTGSEPYAGLLDDVRVYDHALTSNEIATVMSGGGGIQPPTISGTTRTGNSPGLFWSTDSGVTYAVYKSTNLLTGWIAQPLTNIVGDGNAKSFVDAAPLQRAAYYRITAR